MGGIARRRARCSSVNAEVILLNPFLELKGNLGK